MQITTKLRRITLFLCGLVLSSGILLAQERTISGTVTATDEGPIPGVNVTVKGTTIGVMTDINGNYSLTVPGPTSVLVFSSIGYVTQELTVGNQTTISVVLVTDVQALQEVVVTGYTTQRRRDLTGAVGVVETDELKAVPTGNLTSQLQGRTSGVSVIGDARPGASAKVRIRGFSSFVSNDPLYIVDGVPTQDISYLNPNDVETMVVLKDASAASIYGSRASNGVIVVNTKRGARGVKVTYDMFTGWSDPGKGLTDDFCTAEEYAQLQWLVYRNDGTVETHPLYGLSTNANPTMPSWWNGKSTDWYAEITRLALRTNHDLTLSGGTENSRYFAALGYLDDNGIIIHNYNKKATGRFNSEFTILNGRLKFGENMTLAFRKGLGVSNLGEGSPFQMGPIRAQSIIPVRWTGPDYVGLSHTFTEGDWGGTGIAPRLGNGGNVVADQTRAKDDWGTNFNMMGNFYIDVKILNGLNFRSSFGGGYATWYGQGFGWATYESSENVLNDTFSEYAGYNFNWVWTNQLYFDRTFGSHKVNGTLGYEAVKDNMGRNVSGRRAGYFSRDVSYRTLNNGSSILDAASSNTTPVALLSMFAKADYSLMDRYFLSATIRRDGSSKFGPDTRYGIFPSFSAAWRLGDEPFFEGLTWLSDMKLRGSWGTMGNQLSLTSQNQFYLYGGSPSQSFYDISGVFSGTIAQGFMPTRIGNPDAKWETAISTDLGFEIALFNDRLTFVFDWYNRKTADLLYQLEMPGTAGSATAPYINIAEMKNTGIDLELGYRDNFGDLGFNANLSFTTYQNEITKIAENVSYFDQGGGTSRIGVANRNMVGHSMSEFFGYQVIGLFQNAAEVSEAPTQDGAAPGFFRMQDTDGDNKITTSDRVFIGNPNPKFEFGLNLGLTYKGFDLSTYIFGRQGNDIFNWNNWWIDFWPSFQGQKSKKLLYESWTPERTDTDVPKASNTSNFSTNTQVVSYYIEDGSYIRMKNLQLGYTLPQSLLNKINVRSIRLYVQGVNLFTITKYTGMDPELGGDDRAFGSDTGSYPNVKQYIFGLNFVL